MPAFNLSCTYDNANRIQTAGSSTFTHNASGDMTSRSIPQATYSWDSLDRLTGVSGSSSISYTYDGTGNRRSRTENGTTVRYVLDVNSSMTNVLMEIDNSGNPINYYIYANGVLISRIKPNGNTRFYQYDSRGSTIAMTDESGQITHKYSYNPYGKVITMQEEDTNPFRFVGGFGVMDEGNGLSYMRARYYDQNLGRFISEDPMWSSNLFSYGSNNPVMFFDPTGNISEKVKQGLIDSILESLLQGKVELTSITSAVFINYVGKRNKATADKLEVLKFFIGFVSPQSIVVNAIVIQIKEDLGLTTDNHEDEAAKHAKTIHDTINNWMKKYKCGPFNLKERQEWLNSNRRP